MTPQCPARAIASWVMALSVLGTAVTAQAPQRCGGPLTGGLPNDCTLEALPLFLGFDYTASAADARRGTLTVTQSTAEGGLRDVTGPFEMAGQLASPALRDVDGDDLPDLVVQSRPTAFDVWLLNADGFFRMAGRINARSLDDIDARGALTIGRVREASGQMVETAYLLDGGQVSTVFQMRIDPASRRCELMGSPDASVDWLNTDVLLAECEARDWN